MITEKYFSIQISSKGLRYIQIDTMVDMWLIKFAPLVIIPCFFKMAVMARGHGNKHRSIENDLKFISICI